VIAGRECDHAALPLLRGKLQQPVRGSPQLERAAGLQAFALQPDSGAPDLTLDEWRTLNLTLDSTRRLDDIGSGQSGNF
jgi:hypothetical protein